MIWTHGPDELKKVHRSPQPGASNIEIHFWIFPNTSQFPRYLKMEDNFLYTDLFVKPTDTHMYLH